MRRLIGSCVTLSLLLIQGCAYHPEFNRLTKQHKLSTQTIKTDYFQHRAVFNQQALEKTRSTVNIYLDGDGELTHRHRLSMDPSPSNPLALKLMALDPNPAIYMSRPCHYIPRYTSHHTPHHKTQPECEPSVWTLRRYGRTVISSLHEAITLVAQEFDSINLIGYSGGGTLAVLLAMTDDRFERIITIAANLDTQAWQHAHGRKDTLTGSLNPAQLIQDKTVSITPNGLHFIGNADPIVPKHTIAIFQHFAPEQAYCYLTVDHDCCWEEHWPELLRLARMPRNQIKALPNCH